MNMTPKDVADWIDDCQCCHDDCLPCRRVAVLRTAQAVIDAARAVVVADGTHDECDSFDVLVVALAAHDQQEKG